MSWQSKRDTRKSLSLLGLLGGAALGAVAMYLADPDRGKRRRAVARDKMQSMWSQTGSALDVASRDLGNRMHGLRAQANRMWRRRHEDVDDDVLVARVRSRLGRAISHPHAVKVAAQGGCVHLSGPILPHEKNALVACVRAVHGVTSVEDHTEVHAQADIPSLQGEGRPPASPRLRIMRDSWPPGLRAIATLGGGSLGMLGLIRRTPGSLALGAVGLGLVARGISNMPLVRSSRQAGQAGHEQTVDLHESVYIAASPETVFDVWREYENFPRFMSNVKEVHDLGEGRSHWIVNGPAGLQLEWDAELTHEERGRLLAWKTVPGSMIEHVGTVHFQPVEEGTRVDVRLSWLPHESMAERAVSATATVFNGNPARQMTEDLQRMKAYVEGMPPAATPAETSSAAGSDVAGKILH